MGIDAEVECGGELMDGCGVTGCDTGAQTKKKGMIEVLTRWHQSKHIGDQI